MFSVGLHYTIKNTPEREHSFGLAARTVVAVTGDREIDLSTSQILEKALMSSQISCLGELPSFNAHESVMVLKSQEGRSPAGDSVESCILFLGPDILKGKIIQIF